MEKLTLIQNDPWLKPYSDAIEGRYHRTIEKEKTLTCGGKQTLAEFASGYLYFGLHRTEDGWVFREWAPHATAIYLIGTRSQPSRRPCRRPASRRRRDGGESRRTRRNLV